MVRAGAQPNPRSVPSFAATREPPDPYTAVMGNHYLLCGEAPHSPAGGYAQCNCVTAHKIQLVLFSQLLLKGEGQLFGLRFFWHNGPFIYMSRR